MTSTNTFQGMDTNAKPSSRVLRPPGGGSSNVFGGSDNESGSPVNRSNKMASSIFAPHEEPQGSPRKTNPPGGKSSGIFAESEALAAKTAEPLSGATSNIFVDTPSKPQTFRHYPLKPKDNIGINAIPSSEASSMKEPAASRQEAGAGPKERADSPRHQGEDPHEPRLGPIPRSHNKVIQPPGGKSSVVFY